MQADWKTLDSAPKVDDEGNPVLVLLYLPGVHHKSDSQGNPTEIAHGKCVGWWDKKLEHWVVGFHPKKEHANKVYPSAWSALPDDPQAP